MTRALLPAFILLLTLAACREEPPLPPPTLPPGTLIEKPKEIPFRQDGTLQFLREDQEVVQIAIEIAETDSATQRGLMQRTSLPERGGMLFIMPQTRVQGFYMANTPLSLDIMFFSADSTLLNIHKYTQPFSTKSLLSDGPARFVVETEAGFADRYGLAAGDRIRWVRD